MVQPTGNLKGIRIPLDLLPHPAKRIKPENIEPNQWEQMKWFIELSKKNLRELRAGDLLNLQEEMLSLEPLRPKKNKDSYPSIEEIETIQKKVSKHLEELIVSGSTLLGPFDEMFLVLRPTEEMFPELPSLFKSLSPSEKTGVVHAIAVTIIGDEGKEPPLLHRFGELLMKFNYSIRRCPHCNGIFLQQRKNAIYCGRRCQSVAFMRSKRLADKTKKSGPKRSSHKLSSRRSQHGKIRR